MLHDRSFHLKSIYMTTTFQDGDIKSVCQSISVNDWTVSIDITNAYLHVPILRNQGNTSTSFSAIGLPIQSTTFWNAKSVDFHQTDGRNHCSSESVCRLTFSVPRSLAQKRSYMRPSFRIPFNSNPPLSTVQIVLNRSSPPIIRRNFSRTWQ